MIICKSKIKYLIKPKSFFFFLLHKNIKKTTIWKEILVNLELKIIHAKFFKNIFVLNNMNIFFSLMAKIKCLILKKNQF